MLLRKGSGNAKQMGSEMGQQNIKVETSFTEAGLIEQRVDIGGEVSRRVLDTCEEQIRLTLIAMGWTAPGADVEGKSSGSMIDEIEPTEAFADIDEMPSRLAFQAERQERKPAPKLDRSPKVKP